MAVGAGLAVAALLLAACSEDLPQNALDPEGPFARKADVLWDGVFWVAVAVFIVVEGLLVYVLFRFRHRPGRGMPSQVHGNRRLEIAWTILPALLLAGVAFPTLGTLFELSRRPPGNVLDVEVTGHQFWWEINYPDEEVVAANELHIPAGRPVFVRLTSVDVVHSFWIPKLAGKQDLRPGQETSLALQADRPGLYLGQCAEYCGASHANMRLRVFAQSQQDFDEWVRRQRRAAPPPPQEVMQVMQSAGCAGCHTLAGAEGFAEPQVGTSTIGPDLTHFGERTTFAGAILRNSDQNLRAWLRDPLAVKPGNDMVLPRRLSEAEIEALVAYLRSLE